MQREGERPDARRTGPVTRARILEAASELFYANGIKATSADRVIERVGVTKVTFYRHFATKDDLVVAYLERRAAWEREAFAQAVASGDATAALMAVASGIGEASCAPGFRGCPFINAAAEYADPEHPVRAVVDAHRRWMHDEFAALAREHGVADPWSVAAQLMVLRDGGMVSGYLGDAELVAATLSAASLAVLSNAERRA